MQIQAGRRRSLDSRSRPGAADVHLLITDPDGRQIRRLVSYVHYAPRSRDSFMRLPLGYYHLGTRKSLSSIHFKIPGPYRFKSAYFTEDDGKRAGVDAWTASFKSNEVIVSLERVKTTSPTEHPERQRQRRDTDSVPSNQHSRPLSANTQESQPPFAKPQRLRVVANRAKGASPLPDESSGEPLELRRASLRHELAKGDAARLAIELRHVGDELTWVPVLLDVGGNVEIQMTDPASLRVPRFLACRTLRFSSSRRFSPDTSRACRSRRSYRLRTSPAAGTR